MTGIKFEQHMPTGLSTLDPVFDGGIPPGSVVLLKGDIGSGKIEFAYSSMIHLSHLMNRESTDERVLIPKDICYITVTKRKESILREISQSFHEDFLSHIDTIHFEDLSDIYFDTSLVPITWYSEYDDIIERMTARRKIHDNLLTTLSFTLDDVPNQSLVILDSLTEIATQYIAAGKWPDLSAYLRGMQRVAKKWNTSFYLILTKGILSPYQEIEVADAMDAVIHFKWEESSSAKRQRVLYIEKFRGVMIHLEDRDLVKFAVKITPERGFEVSNIRVVI
ncbi:RAD55 family ATPase [Methanospirillum hungatei]|uniref:RAD55 family ATPase n=1 Tax=Methanospirillum hungatei TaxID=2203 RepID=UPI0026EAE5D2|nr:RAD55 family ATPase [Methanospirillum hungatei]MCA1917539.1 RAD55 family ATPase [Methanospirillum hungatei]